MSNPVYLEPGVGPDLARVTLAGGQAKHARVKRTEIGELIDVVDGAGLRLTVEVDGLDPVTGPVVHRVREEAPSRPLTLVQGLAKGGRDEAALEAAIEVGYSEIIPWQADRSISRWDGKADKARAKWEQVALAAMKQSRQAFTPVVHPVHTTAQLAAAAKEAGARLLICHERAARPLTSVSLGTGPIWVVVGPEGGITDREVEVLGGEPVLLGETILRTSTAGPVAGAMIHVLTGRW